MKTQLTHTHSAILALVAAIMLTFSGVAYAQSGGWSPPGSVRTPESGSQVVLTSDTGWSGDVQITNNGAGDINVTVDGGNAVGIAPGQSKTINVNDAKEVKVSDGTYGDKQGARATYYTNRDDSKEPDPQQTGH